jgi:multiple sugar transport system ATP-binding protein
MNDAAIRPSSAEISAPVILVEALGSESMVHLNIDAPWVDAGDPDAVADIGYEKAAVARFSPKSTVRAGDIARIAVDAEELHFFEPDPRTSIW